MTLGMFIQTLLEIGAVAFIIWGLFNEQKLVRFEERIKAAFRRRQLKVTQKKSPCNNHCA